MVQIALHRAMNVLARLTGSVTQEDISHKRGEDILFAHTPSKLAKCVDTCLAATATAGTAASQQSLQDCSNIHANGMNVLTQHDSPCL